MQTLCLFDLDRTLLKGSTIEHLGETFEKETEVADVLKRRQGRGASVAESRRLMALFRDIDEVEFNAACGATPLHPEVEQVGRCLAESGCRSAVVTAGYLPAAERAARAVGADDVVALVPEAAQGRLTGRLRTSPWEGDCGRMVCKAEVLRRLRAVHAPRTVVAVGDGANDVCMFRAADLSIAVGEAHSDAVSAADVGPVDLAKVPALVGRYMARQDEGWQEDTTGRGRPAPHEGRACTGHVAPSRVPPSASSSPSNPAVWWRTRSA